MKQKRQALIRQINISVQKAFNWITIWSVQDVTYVEDEENG